MGGVFFTATGLSVDASAPLIVHEQHHFELNGCYDLPCGAPIDLLVDGAIAGRGVIEKMSVSETRTSGRVRVIAPEEALRLHSTPRMFTHNYILWPDDDIGVLEPGRIIQTTKDKRRRFPIGVPIDLALGHTFRIVAQVKVLSFSVESNSTTIEAQIIHLYTAEEAAMLTRLAAVHKKSPLLTPRPR